MAECGIPVDQLVFTPEELKRIIEQTSYVPFDPAKLWR